MPISITWAPSPSFPTPHPNPEKRAAFLVRGRLIGPGRDRGLERGAFADLGRSLCCAAAVRIARFGLANEHGDWKTAHHVFTYCNAVHQGLKRIGSAPDLAADSVEAARAVLHGAMAIYLTRYLNVPPARLPGEVGEPLKDAPSKVEDIRAALMDAFDRQHRVDEAANLVARHLALGHPPDLIIAALAHALLREDAGFHAYQIFEGSGANWVNAA
jgi:hypothetical protein